MANYPKNEGEMLEALIPKLTPARRNSLERMADQIGYPYDRKEYEYRPREYVDWDGTYPTDEEVQKELETWELINNLK